MAGPATLAKLKVFAEMTPEIVKRSELSASGAAETQGGASTAGTAPAPKRSIWGTIKGLFS
ncbi:hypothetical protein D3C83_167760 [compost metagenome]